VIPIVLASFYIVCASAYLQHLLSTHFTISMLFVFLIINGLSFSLMWLIKEYIVRRIKEGTIE
jgi:uncharacterized iron-regulated membrane protein